MTLSSSVPLMVRWFWCLVIIGSLGAAPAGLAEASSPSGYQLNAPNAIGPVSLGEPKWRVERALRHPTGRCGATCYRSYNGRRGNLTVQYNRGRVVVLGSNSGQITLDGVPLGQGPKRFRKLLRDWRHFRCYGDLIYEDGSGPTASIYFHQNHSIDVDLSAAGVGGCLAP
jgi:hypothetical protein